MNDFFADFTFSTFNEAEDSSHPRGLRLRASSMEDAIQQTTIIQRMSPMWELERISKKPTKGMKYEGVMEI